MNKYLIYFALCVTIALDLNTYYLTVILLVCMFAFYFYFTLFLLKKTSI